MKKLILSFAIMILIVNAGYSQFIVGGSFSFSSSVEKNNVGEENEYVEKSNSINFSPKVGVFLNESLLVGGILSLSREADRIDTDPEQLYVNSGFGLYPFARYYAIQMNRFALFVEGRAGLSFRSSFEEAGNITIDGPKYSTLSVSALPGLSYELSDRVNLEAYINGLNFYAGITTETTELNDGSEIKDRYRDINLGANTNNVISVSGFTIGAIIKL